MKKLLSRENLDLLAQLAWSRVLVAFDFDGTLAPICPDRDAAQMRPRTGELFAKVCRLYPCAVISGRARCDVASRLGRAPVKYVLGNHGIEPGEGLEELERQIARARAQLEESLAGCAGVDIEDKRYSLALHYRRSRRKRLDRAAIHAAVASLPTRMRIVPGKLVANVVPEHAPNKGDALLSLRAAERADTALYVGDDVTDEDVFTLDQPGRLLTVRVGESRSSAAAYFLRDQKEIDRLLGRLVTHREERD
jgi:trehalose 6-phosphate phosphatase